MYTNFYKITLFNKQKKTFRIKKTQCTCVPKDRELFSILACVVYYGQIVESRVYGSTLTSECCLKNEILIVLGKMTCKQKLQDITNTHAIRATSSSARAVVKNNVFTDH